MTNLEYLNALIAKAANGDESAEKKLRGVVISVGERAPLESLVKVSRFLAEEIWRDADRSAVEQN